MKPRRSTIYSLFLVALSLLLYACGGPKKPPSKPKRVTVESCIEQGKVRNRLGTACVDKDQCETGFEEINGRCEVQCQENESRDEESSRCIPQEENGPSLTPPESSTNPNSAGPKPAPTQTEDGEKLTPIGENFLKKFEGDQAWILKIEPPQFLIADQHEKPQIVAFKEIRLTVKGSEFGKPEKNPTLTVSQLNQPLTVGKDEWVQLRVTPGVEGHTFVAEGACLSQNCKRVGLRLSYSVGDRTSISRVHFKMLDTKENWQEYLPGKK